MAKFYFVSFSAWSEKLSSKSDQLELGGSVYVLILVRTTCNSCFVFGKVKTKLYRKQDLIMFEYLSFPLNEEKICFTKDNAAQNSWQLTLAIFSSAHVQMEG